MELTEQTVAAIAKLPDDEYLALYRAMTPRAETILNARTKAIFAGALAKSYAEAKRLCLPRRRSV